MIKPINVLALGLSGSFMVASLAVAIVPHSSGAVSLSAYSDCPSGFSPSPSGDGCLGPATHRERHHHRVPCNVKYRSAHMIHRCKVNRHHVGEIGTAVSIPASNS